jgi:hypothetical protein
MAAAVPKLPRAVIELAVKNGLSLSDITTEYEVRVTATEHRNTWNRELVRAIGACDVGVRRFVLCDSTNVNVNECFPMHITGASLCFESLFDHKTQRPRVIKTNGKLSTLELRRTEMHYHAINTPWQEPVPLFSTLHSLALSGVLNYRAFHAHQTFDNLCVLVLNFDLRYVDGHGLTQWLQRLQSTSMQVTVYVTQPTNFWLVHSLNLGPAYQRVNMRRCDPIGYGVDKDACDATSATNSWKEQAVVLRFERV